MPRLIWLADELRKAGLRVVEVDGWRSRGSTDFLPVGMTWHATAGSRTSTAQGEVNVILNGSTSAPPPIAQLMLYRDGTIYVCAAGRCNHNKVGWAGPNEGLGNTRLLGLEMANDNRGEPWPDVQLDAARRATAAILRRLGADPMRRLAGHYEHQPYATRPPGETSTKSDPAGVDMAQERRRVAAIMQGDDNVTPADIQAIADAVIGKVDDAVLVALKSADGQKAIGKGVHDFVTANARKDPKTGLNPPVTLGDLIRWADLRSERELAAVQALSVIVRAMDAREAAEVPPTALANARATLDALAAAGSTPEQTAAALRVVLGDRAADVGRLLAGAGPA